MCNHVLSVISKLNYIEFSASSTESDFSHFLTKHYILSGQCHLSPDCFPYSPHPLAMCRLSFPPISVKVFSNLSFSFLDEGERAVELNTQKMKLNVFLFDYERNNASYIKMQIKSHITYNTSPEVSPANISILSFQNSFCLSQESMQWW